MYGVRRGGGNRRPRVALDSQFSRISSQAGASRAVVKQFLYLRDEWFRRADHTLLRSKL